MSQLSALLAGFIGTTLSVEYVQQASLSFKTLLTLMIAMIFLGITFLTGVWGDPTSVFIGAVIGVITALLL